MEENSNTVNSGVSFCDKENSNENAYSSSLCSSGIDTSGTLCSFEPIGADSLCSSKTIGTDTLCSSKTIGIDTSEIIGIDCDIVETGTLCIDGKSTETNACFSNPDANIVNDSNNIQDNSTANPELEPTQALNIVNDHNAKQPLNNESLGFTIETSIVDKQSDVEFSSSDSCTSSDFESIQSENSIQSTFSRPKSEGEIQENFNFLQQQFNISIENELQLNKPLPLVKVRIGFVQQIHDNLILIKSTLSTKVLDLDCDLFTGEKYLGRVIDVVGRVDSCFYVCVGSCNIGDLVYSGDENMQDMACIPNKGTDASGAGDFETDGDFSDDEKEREFKKKKKLNNTSSKRVGPVSPNPRPCVAQKSNNSNFLPKKEQQDSNTRQPQSWEHLQHSHQRSNILHSQLIQQQSNGFPMQQLPNQISQMNPMVAQMQQLNALMMMNNQIHFASQQQVPQTNTVINEQELAEFRRWQQQTMSEKLLYELNKITGNK